MQRNNQVAIRDGKVYVNNVEVSLIPLDTSHSLSATNITSRSGSILSTIKNKKAGSSLIVGDDNRCQLQPTNGSEPVQPARYDAYSYAIVLEDDQIKMRISKQGHVYATYGVLSTKPAENQQMKVLERGEVFADIKAKCKTNLYYDHFIKGEDGIIQEVKIGPLAEVLKAGDIYFNEQGEVELIAPKAGCYFQKNLTPEEVQQSDEEHKQLLSALGLPAEKYVSYKDYSELDTQYKKLPQETQIAVPFMIFVKNSDIFKTKLERSEPIPHSFQSNSEQNEHSVSAPSTPKQQKKRSVIDSILHKKVEINFMPRVKEKRPSETSEAAVTAVRQRRDAANKDLLTSSSPSSPGLRRPSDIGDERIDEAQRRYAAKEKEKNERIQSKQKDKSETKKERDLIKQTENASSNAITARESQVGTLSNFRNNHSCFFATVMVGVSVAAVYALPAIVQAVASSLDPNSSDPTSGPGASPFSGGGHL